MDRTNGGASLLSLDAVVIDAETTGLDPRKARMIELAGVRLSAGKLAADASFSQLLRPEDIAHGTPATNTVSVKRLSARDRDRLRVALQAVSAVDELTRDLLFGD